MISYDLRGIFLIFLGEALIDVVIERSAVVVEGCPMMVGVIGGPFGRNVREVKETAQKHLLGFHFNMNVRKSILFISDLTFIVIIYFLLF